MLLLAFAWIIFFFLCIGSLVFMACILLPKSRRHALSAALWCAVWGPCFVALLVIAGLGLFMGSLMQERGHLQQLQQLVSAIERPYAILGILGTAILASLIAWLHQGLIHRMTFVLFRIYACLVVAGVGSVYGWAFSFWTIHKNLFPVGSLTVPLLTIIFGYGGFRWARQLRGDQPQKFTWIRSEEFSGNP